MKTPEQYISLVYKICKKYKNIKTNDTSYDDIVSEAMLAMMRAIDSYDPGKGDQDSYVYFKISFGIKDYLRSLPTWDHNAKKKRRVYVNNVGLMNGNHLGGNITKNNKNNWDSYIYSCTDPNAINPDEFSMIKDVESVIDSVDLKFEYKYVLRMLYINNFHINDLAKEMNCSDKYVFRLRLEAIRALQAVIFGEEKKS